ncbi:ATP-dependent helicase [Nostoc sp. FACHB-87]|uniref:UvrD-helicase domain-containing protein n=1 Tax=Nostocaceae TaxID=1162 RepID=UPI00168728FB|nr:MULTISPECIES: ATP-dependent helicase [Nostocaceae]MBD2458392.1 ATP-dependent helicase [Nostoc sp. FACHB-87]MBD2479513.1 ATP-dependent helicase [Anabaena sp. FACHB-83]
MARGNPNPKTEHLPKQKANWNNLPTEVARVPKIFLEEILGYARSLDGQCSPFEAIISVLDKLKPDELAQIKLAIECLSGTELVEPDVKNDACSNLTEHSDSPQEAQLSDAEIAAYTAKFGFVPSKYQLAIVDWILRGKGNGCCNAVAGSGKSSTLKIVAKILEESGLRPSEIKICVFGKLNAQDLIKKFGRAWKESISTLHSAGFTLVKKELGIRSSYDIDVSGQKYKRIAQDLGLIPKRGNAIGRLRTEEIIGNDNDFLTLIDLVRLTNQQPTQETIIAIAKHHEIENVFKPDLTAKWIAYCLQIGEEKAIKKECLDFTDQIWLPVKWRLGEAKWFRPYKFVLVDEAQDLNATQLELALMLAGSTGRILAVGDPRQAIFGFAGADDQSYQKIVQRTKAIQLFLSICYRCPKSHIQLVKKIYPQIPIEAAPNASEGSIHQISNDEVEKLIKNGDMVIGRKTAPLVHLCIKLISKGIKATVKGKDIGESLKKDLDEIAKLPGYSFQFFNETILNYHQIKAQQYQGLDNEEQMLENLKDKLQAITIIYQSQPQARNIEDLKLYIDSLFSDENSPITLSTCHRAKGLEGERIFIYKPEDMPMVWKKQQDWQLVQEENLLYVALTRSKSELFIVGYPDWYNPSTKPTMNENDRFTNEKNRKPTLMFAAMESEHWSSEDPDFDDVEF